MHVLLGELVGGAHGWEAGVLVLLMVVAPVHGMNNAFIQAVVREENGLTIASTPTHRHSATMMKSGIKKATSSG